MHAQNGEALSGYFINAGPAIDGGKVEMISFGHKQVNKRRAMSLLELVLVSVIIATLSAIAVPRYASSLNRYRTERAAQRIIADLAMARDRARAAGANSTVLLDPNSNQYHLVGISDLNKGQGGYIVDLSVEPYNAELLSVDFGGSEEAVFDGYGVPNSAGQIVIKSGSYQKTIVLNADSGKASVQ